MEEDGLAKHGEAARCYIEPWWRIRAIRPAIRHHGLKMRSATTAIVILGCVAAATAAFSNCVEGQCEALAVQVEPVNTAVSSHHRAKRAPILLAKAALLGAGALGVGALGVGALGVGALGVGALGAGAIGAGALAGGYGRSYGGYGYGYGGPHYHYHSSPVVYGGSYGYGGGYGYGGYGSYGYGGYY